MKTQIPEDHILRWDSFEGRRKPAEGKRIGEVSSTWAQSLSSLLQNLQTFEVGAALR